MSADTITMDAYQSEIACAQGPFEIVVEASGHRWGEGIAVIAFSPRPIVGVARIVVAGEEAEPSRGSAFGPSRTVGSCCDSDQRWTTETESAEGPDNARCLADASAVSAAAGAGVATTVTSGGQATSVDPLVGGGGTVGVDGSAIVDGTATIDGTISAPHLSRVDWSHGLYMDGESLRTNNLGRLAIVQRSWETTGDDFRTELAAGTPITIQIWSLTPNDLEGVTFVVHHYQQQPSVSDEEWIAHLEEERANAQRESDERTAAEERRQAEWQARCAADHDDEECWGPGGYDGAIARQEAAGRVQQAADRARADAPASTPPPSTERVAAPVHVEPGVPPAPLEDPRPPKQSQNADWVPGYWYWADVRWVWVAGFWRVPESDIASGLTVRAPTAPPAPRAETAPAAPAAGMVWVTGYWMWDGAQWVWIAGAWRVAQGAATQWQPPRWEVRIGGGGGFVLTPGRLH